MHGKKTLQDMYKIWLSYGDTIIDNNESDTSDDETKCETSPILEQDLFITCPNELLCLIATYLGSNAHRDRLGMIRPLLINIDGPKCFVQHITSNIYHNFNLDTMVTDDKYQFLIESNVDDNTIIYANFNVSIKHIQLLTDGNKIIITNNKRYNEYADYVIEIPCDEETITSYIQYIYKCTDIVAKQIFTKLDIHTIITNKDSGIFCTVFMNIRYILARYPSTHDLINN